MNIHADLRHCFLQKTIEMSSHYCDKLNVDRDSRGVPKFKIFKNAHISKTKS